MPLSLRLLSVGIVLATAGLSLWVQHGLRPALATSIPLVTGILGFLPNLIVGMGAPFLSVVISRRAPGVRVFAKSCAIILAVLLLHEYDQVRNPRLYFDWYDVAASIAGVLIAWRLYALLHERMDLENHPPQKRTIVQMVDDVPAARSDRH